jgi:hypothetical protein
MDEQIKEQELIETPQ